MDDPIRFYHYQKGGFDLLWALGQLSNPKNIRDLQIAIRFDITREALQHYYEEPFVLDAQAAKLVPSRRINVPSPMYVGFEHSSTEHTHWGKKMYPSTHKRRSTH